MPEISIVCGLGNPGPRYRSTRHNLGFMALDVLSERHSLSWKRVAGPSQRAFWRAGGEIAALLKPLSYMNDSGFALERYGGVDAASLLVVCDDLNLPLGRLRLRPSGRSGGHRGLESIIERLGTTGFARLRLGIGAPSPGVDRVEYVLTDFLSGERELVSEMIEEAADVIEEAALNGLDAAIRRCGRGPL